MSQRCLLNITVRALSIYKWNKWKSFIFESERHKFLILLALFVRFEHCSSLETGSCSAQQFVDVARERRGGHRSTAPVGRHARAAARRYSRHDGRLRRGGQLLKAGQSRRGTCAPAARLHRHHSAARSSQRRWPPSTRVPTAAGRGRVPTVGPAEALLGDRLLHLTRSLSGGLARLSLTTSRRLVQDGPSIASDGVLRTCVIAIVQLERFAQNAAFHALEPYSPRRMWRLSNLLSSRVCERFATQDVLND